MRDFEVQPAGLEADMDQDGLQDLVVGFGNANADEPNGIKIFYNSSNPERRFGSSKFIALDQFILDLSIGNLDNDPDMEIVAVGYNGVTGRGGSLYYLNRREDLSYDVEKSFSHGKAVYLVDINSDGRLDIFFARYASSLLFLNNAKK